MSVVIYPWTNREVAHLPGVVAAVAEAAVEIGARAEGLLAVHTKTGNHHIRVEHEKVDSFVILEGRWAIAVELGRYQKPGSKGGSSKGLHILGRAAGTH